MEGSGGRRLHNEELHNLYGAANIIRAIKSSMGHVARVREKRNAYNILVGKHEGKRPLGRPRGRWEGNTERILRRQLVRVWNGFM
jgi:hypothetical protein